MAAAVAVLLCAGPARAAAPVTLGTPGTGSGGIPDIAIDASGRAHVVWYEGGTPQVTRYCQLPRGGAGCVNPKTFGPAPGESPLVNGLRPHVFVPSPGRVVVLDTRDFDYGVRQSTDGGLSFGGRTEIGDIGSTPDDAVFGPGESVTAISEVPTSGARVQNAPLAGPFQEQWASLDSGGMMADGAVGLHDGKPVVVYTDQSDLNDSKLSWRMYKGGGTTMNAAGNWTNEVLIEDNEGYPPDHVSLAGGPRGLFLLYKLVRPGNHMFVVRKFTGAAFGPAIKVSDTASLNGGDLTQDGSGRLHVVWDTNNTNDLRWTFSDDGINWSPPVTIDAADSPHAWLRVAAAPDHGGFAVWKAAGGLVRAVPLEPLPTVVGPDPVPIPARDTVAPVTSGLSVSDSTLKPGQGATFRFRASEPGRALLTIDRAVAGLKLKAKGKSKPSCFAETKKRLAGLRKQLAKRSDVRRLSGKRRARKLAALVKRRRCTPWRKVTALTRGIQAGVNSIVFSGKVNGRALKAGRYRAVLIAADAAGNVSRKQVTEFRVLARKKKRGRR